MPRIAFGRVRTEPIGWQFLPYTPPLSQSLRFASADVYGGCSLVDVSVSIHVRSITFRNELRYATGDKIKRYIRTTVLKHIYCITYFIIVQKCYAFEYMKMLTCVYLAGTEDAS